MWGEWVGVGAPDTMIDVIHVANTTIISSGTGGCSGSSSSSSGGSQKRAVVAVVCPLCTAALPAV